jgi:hypothetical protein
VATRCPNCYVRAGAVRGGVSSLEALSGASDAIAICRAAWFAARGIACRRSDTCAVVILATTVIVYDDRIEALASQNKSLINSPGTTALLKPPARTRRCSNRSNFIRAARTWA